MKKIMTLLLLCVGFLFCGCEKEQEISYLRIVDGAETGQLVLAGERASDVYTLDMKDIKVFLDGKKSDASVLEDGMKHSKNNEELCRNFGKHPVKNK